ncbi:MAG: hypothetical protein L6R30_24410 [Thermoanaerobaculia bacterium]|nr:hypothetical protein [Thermoanaerobaculia bacterium]
MTESAVFPEFLDFLGLASRPDAPGFTEHLFHAFQHRFPFHRPASPGRNPEVVLADFLEGGRGTNGAERACALHALLEGAGLSPVRTQIATAGQVPGFPLPKSRPASIVTSEGGQILLDASLPAALVLDGLAAPIPTPIGSLSVRQAAGTWEIVLDSRGEEAPLGRLSETAPEDVEPSDDRDSLPELFRFLPDRTLSWSGGRMEVSDAWSRLEFGLPSLQRTALEGLFGEPLPEDLSPAEPEVPPSLSVYCAADQDEEAVLGILKHPEKHVVILPAGTVVESLSTDSRGWFWTLTLESSRVSEEMVRVEPDGVLVHYGGSGVPLKEKRIRVEGRPGGSRLVSTGILSRALPPTGPSESVRKTIVFHLASELLALAEKAG